MKAAGLEKISLKELRAGLKAQEEELKLKEIEDKQETACMSRKTKKFGKFSQQRKATPDVNCYVCGRHGHYARNCYSRTDIQKKDN